MSGFSLKPAFTGNTTANSDAPQVDWNAINNQVKTDNHLAIISQIVDLGVHTPPLSANTENTTEFETHTEAAAFVEEVKPMLPKAKADKIEISPKDGKFVVNAQIRQPKDRQEVAIFADLVGAVVDYGGIGKKPYRILLNKSFKGDIRGLGLTQVPPVKKGGAWTFPPASLLTELATVTKQTEIIDGSDKHKLNDIGLLLGQPLMVDVVKTVSDSGSVYVNVKGVGSVPSMLEAHIDRSLVKPYGISFDTVTPELLKEAGVRFNVIKKIQTANNYANSNMRLAVEAVYGGAATATTAPAETPAPTQAPVSTAPADLDDDCPF